MPQYARNGGEPLGEPAGETAQKPYTRRASPAQNRASAVLLCSKFISLSRI